MTLTQMKQIQVKAPAKIVIVGGVVISLLMTPLVFAWDAKVSASAQCDRSGEVEINISYTNEFNKSADVIATDEQTQISLNLGAIKPNETETGNIITGRNRLDSGMVDFKITNAGGETKEANYSATGPCMGPTPTPSPKPTATPTPTSYPTATPTPYPTSTPMPTMTPQPTPPPSINNNNNNSNNNGNDNQNNQNQNVTQNSNPTINITNDNNPNISNSNTITLQTNANQEVLGASTSAQTVSVAPASQTTSLPSTGAETDILFGLFSMLPAGLGLRSFSKFKK